MTDRWWSRLDGRPPWQEQPSPRAIAFQGKFLRFAAADAVLGVGIIAVAAVGSHDNAERLLLIVGAANSLFLARHWVRQLRRRSEPLATRGSIAVAAMSSVILLGALASVAWATRTVTPYKVRLTSCRVAADGASADAQGTLRNTSRHDRSYVIEVGFAPPGGAIRAGGAGAHNEYEVAGGKTIVWDVPTRLVVRWLDPATRCRVSVIALAP